MTALWTMVNAGARQFVDCSQMDLKPELFPTPLKCSSSSELVLQLLSWGVRGDLVLLFCPEGTARSPRTSSAVRRSIQAPPMSLSGRPPLVETRLVPSPALSRFYRFTGIG